jgi:hypothetical protein
LLFNIEQCIVSAELRTNGRRYINSSASFRVYSDLPLPVPAIDDGIGLAHRDPEKPVFVEE